MRPQKDAEAESSGLRLFDPELFLAEGPPGQAERQAFRRLVLDYHAAFGRDFPWRQTEDPWAILVSEIMLQQTQTERVVHKYLAFLEAFPRPEALADSGVDRLLGLWQGLGYNRRALALKAAATAIAAAGGFPDSLEGLLALPGVGPYTARAVLAFAFHVPSAFIETNIRSVYLHHFFPGGQGIADSRLLALAEASLGDTDPRTWYYALMDYGVYLKRRHGNPNARGAGYAKQTPFADSHRRIRGAVLREATTTGEGLSLDSLAARLPFARERVAKAVKDLVAEGFLEYRKDGEELGLRGKA